MTFTTRLSDHDLHPFFYVKVEGIPCIFTSVPSLGWAAPTSGGHAYTVLDETLDVGQGLATSSTIERREGRATTSGLALRLVETATDDLLALFAARPSSGLRAELDATVPYDTGAPARIWSVVSTTGWPSAGLAYRGRETVYYPAITGTTFGDVGSEMTRSLFGSRDHKVTIDPSLYQGPVYVTSYPEVWHGRFVQVFANLMHEDGTSLDLAFGGAHEIEIYRGMLKGRPRPGRDCLSYSLDTDALTSILETEVGRDAVKAALLRVTAGEKANQTGQWDGAAGLPGTHGDGYWIDGSTNQLSWTVEEWASLAAFNAGSAPTAVKGYSDTAHLPAAYGGGDVTGGIYLAGDVFNLIFPATINDLTQVDFPDLTVTGHAESASWATISASATGAPPAYYRVTLRFGAAHSLGRLMGYSSDLAVTTGGPGAGGSLDKAPSIYVAPDSDTIPFYYADSSGLCTDVAPASGYAKIGGKEIVSYSAISAVSGFTPIYGLWVMTGCRRGLFGTEATEHVVTSVTGAGVHSAPDPVEVEFCIGWEDASFTDVLAQLAVSTGVPAHYHATHDVLPEGWAVPLDPSHFDFERFARIKAELPPELRRRSLILGKPAKLGDLFAEECKLLGLYFVARRVGSSFLITLDEITPPLEAAGTVTALGSGQLSLDAPAEHEEPDGHVISAFEVATWWDAIEEQARDARRVVVRAPALIADTGKLDVLKVEPRGICWDAGRAVANFTILGARIFSAVGSERDAVVVQTDATGWAIQPGQSVTLTLAVFPSRTGTRGLVARQFTVQAASYTYWPRDGQGAIGARLVCTEDLTGRYTCYGPTARILSAPTPPAAVVLDANVFSAAADEAPTGEVPCVDAAWFAEGDVVWIFEAGDATTKELHTLGARTATGFLLDAPLVLVPGARTLMVFADHGGAIARQQKFCYLADNTPELSDGSDPFRYV